MANITDKILGQAAPAATTNTDVYTVPAGSTAIVFGIALANRGASLQYRIAVRPGGAAIANQHYIAYDVTLAANQWEPIPIKIGLEAADVITVHADSADLSITVTGVEFS